jgi:type II secretory pathway component PulK
MKKGQTLVILLVFVMIAVIVTTASIILAIANIQASGRQVLSGQAYDIAESGIEDALLTLLRNPFYTGETLTVGDGTATIVITGTGDNTVTSAGRLGNYVRTIQATTTYFGGIMTITSWQEIFP